MKWGEAPIAGRYDGERYATKEHRGRKWPITGCPCRACYVAWISLGLDPILLGEGPA